MFRIIPGTVILALLCLSASAKASVLIDFGPDFGAPPASVVLTDQLQSYGVLFSCPSPQGTLWHGTDPPIGSYSYCISAGWDGGLISTEAIRVDFDPYVVEASIRGYDGGGDIDTLVLRAFDSMGTQVDDDTITAVFGYPGHVASVSAVEIAYITFGVEGTTSGLFFDDLGYTFVPAPGTLAALALLLPLTGRRRR